jgi:dihydropteroate synthase
MSDNLIHQISQMSAQDTFFSQKTERIFDQNALPRIFGILNITPDSFYDGGNYLKEEQWLKKTEQLLTDGADVIDIGAYSSRPGAEAIDEAAEAKRLIPVVKSIRKHFPDAILSADTFRSIIAQKAVEEGANIINDIGGGTLDDKMFETIIRLDVPYVLMHIKGNPQTMQSQAVYQNVQVEVYSFFEERINFFKKHNFKKLILDPGFGFAKTMEQNYELLAGLENFENLGFPIMVGFSRKSMISKLLAVKTEDTLNGTSVLNTIALMKGAKILRVHDVMQAKQAVTLVKQAMH